MSKKEPYEITVVEVITHTITVNTQKQYRFAEEIAIDYLDMMRTEKESQETLRKVTAHTFKSEVSVYRMMQEAETNLENLEVKTRGGIRMVG